jgi:predicted amidohydrolase YtcJ
MCSEHTRRTFFKSAAAAGLAYAIGGRRISAQTAAGQRPDADMILMNGRLATQDERRSFASAAAVKDGRFLAVGSDQDVLAYRGDRTQMIDVGGRTVIPGLNDSHMHPIRGGLNYNMELRWDGVPSLADALRMLREQAQRTPPPNGREWSAAGRSSSSPSAACPPSTRSTPPRPTRRPSSCTSTTVPS